MKTLALIEPIGGVPRPDAYLAAGYCVGLSMRDDLNLDEHDRNILRSAGRALEAALSILYDEQPQPKAKPCPPSTNAATSP